jgi:hypothetical protein
VREARSYEFEKLVQGDLSVTEYEVEFTRLSRFAGYLVPTEERKIKSFVRGLNSYLFKAIGAHEFKTYSATSRPYLTRGQLILSCRHILL